jgi:uncharacterized membrane protein
MSVLDGIVLFLGGIFVLFVPGFAWSYVFFARKSIDWIERLALTCGLSIVLVPLSVFWLNRLFHMKITLLSTTLTVSGLTILAGTCIIARRYPWTRDAITRLKSLTGKYIPARRYSWIGNAITRLKALAQTYILTKVYIWIRDATAKLKSIFSRHRRE